MNYLSLNTIFNYKKRMASLQKLLFLLIAFYLSLGFGQSQEIINTKIAGIDRDMSCQSNPEHTYHIFVPSAIPDDKQLPLLVVIDPYGNGKLAVAGFKDAARKYEAVVACSDLVKVNDDKYLQELEELISDIKQRFPAGDELYIGGFSAGARMALNFANKHPVNGVFACNTIPKHEEVQLLKYKVMSIISMDDVNFIEAAPFVLDPAKIPSNLFIEMTKAANTWSEEEILQQAIGYLLFATPSGNMMEKRKKIREYVDQQKRLIDSLDQANEDLQAALIVRNLMSSVVFEREGSFMAFLDQQMESINYQRQNDELRNSIQFETGMRKNYYDAIAQKDSAWWKAEIELLNSKIKTEKNEYTRLTYKRIKGFLGIVCYELSNRFAGEKDAQKLEQVLTVYRMVEPRNPDMLQFSKVLNQIKQ